MSSRYGTAPSLDGATGWLNTDALGPDALRGRVVLYVFWTYTCINWLRISPYVKAWAAAYQDAGLVVVGVHTPEFVFERQIENVRRATLSHDVVFPVVLDSDYVIWRAFDNHYWPAIYLADASGAIRHVHFGEDGYVETEKAIKSLLEESGHVVHSALVDVTGRGDEAAADWDHLRTPETYFTFGADGVWTLSGEWTRARDRVTAAEPGAAIAIRFHARDLHVVLAPLDQSRPVRVHVTLDGSELGENGGIDVDDAGTATVSEPRMYQLIRQEQPVRDRTALISFLDGGASAFVVTFG